MLAIRSGPVGRESGTEDATAVTGNAKELVAPSLLPARRPGGSAGCSQAVSEPTKARPAKMLLSGWRMTNAIYDGCGRKC